jgi:ACS family 4-hydroxyphenylacetate permease-like MFS transporter
MIAMPVTAGVGSALSGLILGLNGMYGLTGWQWLFLLEGLPAAVLGVVAYYYLTDSPKVARWLADDEKAALSRMLSAEHKSDPVPQSGSARKSLFSELTSATVLKFSIAYFAW